MNSESEEPKLKAQQQYKALRDKLGRKPSTSEFYRESGISDKRLEQIYGGKAYRKLVTECGDQPSDFIKPKSELRNILEVWAKLARELKAIPVGADWSQHVSRPLLAVSQRVTASVGHKYPMNSCVSLAPMPTGRMLWL